MEVVGTVASVLQVAEIGFSLASTLYKYATSVKGAEKDIKKIARDVKLTSKVLQRTYEQIKEDHEAQLCTDEALVDLEDVLDGCKEAFEEVNEALNKSMRSANDGKSTLSMTERFKWPLKANKLEILRANLEKLKTTLLLMLSVLAYGSKIANQTKAEVKIELTLEKLQIQNLVQAQDEATQRYQDLSKAFTQLENRINETSIGISSPVTSHSAMSLFALPTRQLPDATARDICASDESNDLSRSPEARPSVTDQLKDCASAVAKLALSIDSASQKWSTDGVLERDKIHDCLEKASVAVAFLKKESRFVRSALDVPEHFNSFLPAVSAPSASRVVETKAKLRFILSAPSASRDEEREDYVETKAKSQATLVNSDEHLPWQFGFDDLSRGQPSYTTVDSRGQSGRAEDFKAESPLENLKPLPVITSNYRRYSPDATAKRRIQFDDRVEQYIAVDSTEAGGDFAGDSDGEDRGSIHRGSDSDDSLLMKPWRRRPSSHSQQYSCDGMKTIEKLPPTTLKYRADGPQVATEAHHHISLRSTSSGTLSPAASQETLRPSFLLLEEDDDDQVAELIRASSRPSSRLFDASDSRASLHSPKANITQDEAEPSLEELIREANDLDLSGDVEDLNAEDLSVNDMAENSDDNDESDEVDELLRRWVKVQA